MKRSTAIGHLVETGQVSSEQLRFRGTDIGWPVEELWVTGDLLSLADTVDAGSVVIALDVPPDEAPWLAINPAGEWAAEQLRLRKRPLLWCYRPLGWPVWNHQHRRLARYWVGAGRGWTTPSSTHCGPDASTASMSWAHGSRHGPPAAGRAASLPRSPSEHDRALPGSRLATGAQGVRRVPRGPPVAGRRSSLRDAGRARRARDLTVPHRPLTRRRRHPRV
jgi:hypothetical protein